MKRITFDKLSRYGFRPNYPGYLFTHSAHPGREFTIARGSVSDPGSREIYRMTGEWNLYDRASGVSLMRLLKPAPTMKGMEERAMAGLFAVTTAQIEDRITAMQIHAATHSLTGEG